MTTPLDSKLVEEFTKRIKEIDERASLTMSDGNLRSFDEYRYSCGYRKAMKDALQVLNETFEDIMKE